MKILKTNPFNFATTSKSIGSIVNKSDRPMNHRFNIFVVSYFYRIDLQIMSDHRRPTVRKYTRRQYQTNESLKTAPDTTVVRQRNPTSNKRTRLESVTSNRANQKKRKDLIETDDEDTEIEEIYIENESRDKIELDRCAICLDDCTKPKQLDKCSHIFCTDCIDHYFQSVKPQCPCCFTIYGEIRGKFVLLVEIDRFV